MTNQAQLRRKWLYIPFAVAGIVLAGYFLLWRTGAHEMKKAVGVWIEDQRAAGIDISHGQVISKGFPFFLRVHIDDPDIAMPDGRRWRTDRLSLDALPYDLNKLILSVPGEQIASLNPAEEWRINAAEFRTSVSKDKTRKWVFSTSITNLTADRIDGANAAIGSLIFDLAPDATDQSTVVLSLASSEIAADINAQSIALDSLRTVTALREVEWISDIAVWRDAGGALIINGLIAQIEDGTLSVAGELSIDRENYPTGRLKTEIISPAAFTKALFDAGVISTEEAQTAGAALTLTAIAGGGKITAPIELKNGNAEIAGVKISSLPKLD